MKKVIPDCLLRAFELLTALDEAEEMRESILSHPEGINLSAEIDYLENQITDLIRQQSRNEKETSKIFAHLKKSDCPAYVAAQLHYSYGYSWQDAGDILGSDCDAVRMQVSRAIGRLVEAGLI